MATLISPGVSVSVIDESLYATGGQGTVPFVLIATAQDKQTPDGSSIAEGTLQENSENLYLITSQRELLQTFGEPVFQSVSGVQMHGSPLNEYGLLATHSYLGVSNRAYVMRVGVPLNELEPTTIEPTNPVAPGTYWYDTDDTSYGLHELIVDPNDPTSFVWNPVSISVVFENSSDDAVGDNGDYGVVVGDVSGTVLTQYIKKVSGIWEDLYTLQDSTPADVDLVAQDVYPSTSTYTESGQAYWIKTTSGSNGASISFRVRNNDNSFDDIEIIMSDSDANAEISLGSDLAEGSIYAQHSFVDGTSSSFSFRIYENGTWVDFNKYEFSPVAPTLGPSDGDYWYNSDVGLNADGESTVDILINNGTGAWENINLPGIDPLDMNGDIDSTVLYTQSLDPREDSSITLNSGDLWIDTTEIDMYPSIYRYVNFRWIPIDLTDQSTPSGIIFADARPNPTSLIDGGPGGEGLNNGAGTAPNLDMGIPDPDAYPAGMLLWNTRYSSMNVKQWDDQFLIYEDTNDLPVYEGRWVTVSTQREDGAPYMGQDAQKSVIVQSMASAISSSDVLRSESADFNLIAAPGFLEVTDELVSLNIDRTETAFVLGDTPFNLRNNGTEINEWAGNLNNAPSNSDEGLVTTDHNLGVFYPSGLSTNLDGSQVVVPPTHMALRTYARNDQVSYPWFAAAGTERGRVTNATSVGYVDSEGEFQPVVLSRGLRDVLYQNNVNPIAVMGNSLLFWGQKTRSPVASSLDRINVARLVNYVRKRIEEIGRPFLWQPNDQQTRDNFKDAVDRFMSELISLRGVTDFLSICDTSVNTPAVVDRNELILELYMIPTKSVEFIYVPIRLRNSGSL